jgi:LysM repeat protein
MSKIAGSFLKKDTNEKVDVKVLARFNAIPNADLIFPGQKIIFPGFYRFVVAQGDTFESIASRFKRC